jgi:hypothetical protein
MPRIGGSRASNFTFYVTVLVNKQYIVMVPCSVTVEIPRTQVVVIEVAVRIRHVMAAWNIKVGSRTDCRMKKQRHPQTGVYSEHFA